MKMGWVFFVTIICLICVCYGQKYDTSGAVTFNANPDSSTSCGGCTISINVFEFTWFQQAYTHVAATIVKVVNNATNATITSTIQGSSFTLPRSAAYGALIVPNSVITTIIGGVVYKLTYPNTYMGVGNIKSHSATAITNAANGSVKCVVSEAAMTGEFLLRKYISNGLELTPYLDGRCHIDMASPPIVLVRVSSVTATTTNYVDRAEEARTSSAKKALPSNSLSPPTAPQTESSRPDNRPTTVSHFFLSGAGTTEIHRGGSTITFTSDTRSISLGDSATTTIIVDESSTTTPSPPPHAVDTVGTSIQVPATQVTTNYTFPLPPATTTTAAAPGNRPELSLLGGQKKLAEVPMLIMFGATFLAIAGRAMVGITLE